MPSVSAKAKDELLVRRDKALGYAIRTLGNYRVTDSSVSSQVLRLAKEFEKYLEGN